MLWNEEKVKYENEKFLAPANVDMYLRARFGNYHTLPKKKHIGDKDIFDKLSEVN